MHHAKFTDFETKTGRLVDLLNPTADKIDFRDVAHALACSNRYNGHGGTYSIAQHCCIVADLLPDEYRIHGLLHDAPEYATGDISSPVKAALSVVCPQFKDAFGSIEHGFERAIYEKAGIAVPTPEIRAAVKRADLIALATEQREILASPNVWNLPYPPANRRIRPVEAWAAFLMYRDALHECGVRF